MADEQASAPKKGLPTWVKGVIGAVIGVAVLNFIGTAIAGHDGPSKLISLGINRFQSCKYAGNFVAGVGFNCVVKNVSTNEHRSATDMACAGFDDQNRMLRSADRVLDLHDTGLAPGEERVVRVYFPGESETGVCSDTGDLGSPPQLQKLMPELQKANVVQEIDL